MKLYYFLLIFFCCFLLNAQDLLMQDGIFNRCAPSKFYDSGGSTGPYSSNEDLVTTICPNDITNGEVIVLEFLTFSTQPNVDVMTIYDGDDTSAPVIGVYSSVNNPGTIIASVSNTSGCITVRFVTDGAVTATGFEADITCAVPCQVIDPFLESSVPEASSAGIIQITSGETVDFVGNANFSVDGDGSTYEWFFGDGSPQETGNTVTHQFNGQGEYTVTLIVTDSNPLGCSETITIPVFVLGPNIIVDTDSFTIEDLVLDILIDSECAEISNITSSTGTDFSDVNGIGYFISDGSEFPFTDGILLTSGDASRAGGPNNNSLSDGFWTGDPDLNAAVGISSQNASIIQFDFVPLADKISFDFLMASEEYNGNTGGVFECSFSDAFAFLLTDSSGVTTNLAVLPGTTTPILVTNIHPANPGCDAINEEFFGGYIDPNAPPMSFDGRTTVFTAESTVNPGEKYTIKLVIADATDNALDSGVFLKAGSFNLGGNLGDDITIVSGNATCGGTEQILDTGVTSGSHTWYLDGVVIPGETSSKLNVTEPGLYSVDVFLSAGCEFSDEIVVEFKPAPESNQPMDFVECEDKDFAPFDLTLNDPIILNGLDPDEFVISYHLNADDAKMNENPLLSPYTNISKRQIIYSRIANLSQDCSVIDSFEIGFTGFTIKNIGSLEVCETDGNGLESFMLSDLNDEALSGLDASTHSVSYHLTLEDAELGVKELVAPYTNIVPNLQTIFLRVELNEDTTCYDTKSLDLMVNLNPIATNPTAIELCDENYDGITQFDLSSKTSEILNGQTNVIVTYHYSLADAVIGENQLPLLFVNDQPNFQIVYARLENSIGDCFTTLELVLRVLRPPPIPDSGLAPLYICELANDGQAQFDLTQQDKVILTGQDPSLFTVSYHGSQAEADNLTGAINSLYTNLSNPQTIYVAVTDNTTGCSISTLSFEIEVQEAATANADGLDIVLEACDDNMEFDGDPSNDSTQFNLQDTGLQAQVLDNQNPADYKVSFYATKEGAESRSDQIPLLYENIENPQVIWARVDNNIEDASGADTSGCFAVAPMTLRVNLLPSFRLEDSYTLCVRTNGTEAIGPPVIETGLGAPQYAFTWALDGIDIAGATSGSYMPDQPGAYTVTVTDLLTSAETRCEAVASTVVVESAPPTLTAEVTSLGFADNHGIEVTATGIGDYEYSIDGGPWQLSNFFEGVSLGDHEVAARDRKGCGLATTEVTILDYPAFFTPNGDGFNDRWNIPGIDSQLDAEIYIFDRHGKLLKQLSPSSQGWDGTYNGSPMPNNDYWFRVEYEEPATQQRKEFVAHFTLKR